MNQYNKFDDLPVTIQFMYCSFLSVCCFSTESSPGWPHTPGDAPASTTGQCLGTLLNQGYFVRINSTGKFLCSSQGLEATISIPWGRLPCATVRGVRDRWRLLCDPDLDSPEAQALLHTLAADPSVIIC